LLGAAVAVLTALPAAGQTIGSADIIDGSIQAIDIAPETITTGRIKNETIQAIDLAPESITTGRILNRTIKAIDIATESITTGEIKNGSIAGVDLADGTVTAAKLAPDATARLNPLTDLVNISAVTLVPRSRSDFGCQPVPLVDPTGTDIRDAFGQEAGGRLLEAGATYFGNAPLPNGVTVTRFTLHARDFDDGANGATARLMRKRFAAIGETPAPDSADTPTEMASVVTTGSDDLVRAFTADSITEPDVDLTIHYYYIEISLDCNDTPLSAVGVQIEFMRN
jgi:hypothetical protein